MVRRSPEGGDAGNKQLDVAKLLVQRGKAPAGQALEQGQEELQVGALLLHNTHDSVTSTRCTERTTTICRAEQALSQGQKGPSKDILCWQ